MGARSRDHRLPFTNGYRGWFFDVNMFPGFTGMNGLDGVPMIRSGDHHRINIFALQNIPVITIRNSAGSTDTGILDRGFQPVIVRIAHGSHAHLSLFLEAQHIGQVRHAHAADANVGDHEPVVRARLRVPAQNSSRRQIERARNQHAALEE